MKKNLNIKIGLDIYMTVNTIQDIIQNNYDLVHWCVCVSLGHDKWKGEHIWHKDQGADTLIIGYLWTNI